MKPELAPSVQLAHQRVLRTWYVALLHAVFLFGLGTYLLTREPPAWRWGVLCLIGVILVPLLGRAAFRGNSLAAFLLLVSVLGPAGGAFLLGQDLTLPLVWVLLVPPYALGVKGALGLRGRRGSRRGQ